MSSAHAHKYKSEAETAPPDLFLQPKSWIQSASPSEQFRAGHRMRVLTNLTLEAPSSDDSYTSFLVGLGGPIKHPLAPFVLAKKDGTTNLYACTIATIGVSGSGTYVVGRSTSFDPLAGWERYGNRDWDGYGADPITTETLEAARAFIRMLPPTLGDPDIAPGADGTIGLEWAFTDRALRKLFIDIGSGRFWSGYWRRATGEAKTLPAAEVGRDTGDCLAQLFEELNQ